MAATREELCAMTVSDPIHELMCSYLDIPGMLAAILVSDEGFVVNCAQSEEIDTDSISALVMDTVSSAQRFGDELRAGRVDTLTVEYETMTLLLAPFEQNVMLALVALPGTFALRSEITAG
jgi:predicted regulator of Ras-like GTPase activity (Roadblock/LC7/MglB family)